MISAISGRNLTPAANGTRILRMRSKITSTILFAKANSTSLRPNAISPQTGSPLTRSTLRPSVPWKSTRNSVLTHPGKTKRDAADRLLGAGLSSSVSMSAGFPANYWNIFCRISETNPARFPSRKNETDLRRYPDRRRCELGPGSPSQIILEKLKEYDFQRTPLAFRMVLPYRPTQLTFDSAQGATFTRAHSCLAAPCAHVR